MQKLSQIWAYFSALYEKPVLWVFIMVSALIVFIGILKPVLFDKIPNKLVRKSLLALSTIVLSFASVAVTFWVEKLNFEFFVETASVFTVCTIIVYWLYENTNLRTLIHALGSRALNVALAVLKIKTDAPNSDNSQIPLLTNELETLAQSVLSSTVDTVDKELKNL